MLASTLMEVVGPNWPGAGGNTTGPTTGRTTYWITGPTWYRIRYHSRYRIRYRTSYRTRADADQRPPTCEIVSFWMDASPVATFLARRRVGGRVDSVKVTDGLERSRDLNRGNPTARPVRTPFLEDRKACMDTSGHQGAVSSLSRFTLRKGSRPTRTVTG